MLARGLLSIFFLKKPIELECGTELLTVITVYFKVGLAHLSERNRTEFKVLSPPALLNIKPYIIVKMVSKQYV